jgi:osmotically-inducible protein OsmY
MRPAIADKSKRSDTDIAVELSHELDWEPRLGGSRIFVHVSEGVATLTGVVESWAKKVAAERVAHGIPGVLDVANDVQVVTPPAHGRSDTEIAHAVRHAPEWDVFVPHERIHTTVSDGVVVLEGEVDHASDHEAAEEAVSNLAGVRRVVNRLQVRAAVLPGDVRRALIKGLARHAVREARHIFVATRDGEVTLSGEVDSQTDRDVIVGAARGVRGVSEVHDLVAVRPRLVGLSFSA